MGIVNLYDQFTNLELPQENAHYQFMASQIPPFANHRIAKDKLGNPTILIHTSIVSDRFSFPNFQLQNVLVSYDVICKIKQDVREFEARFTKVSFIGYESNLKKYFIKLCSLLVSNLGEEPTQKQVHVEVSRFIELLRLATEQPTKTIQGLWSELFLINESIDPINLLTHWRSKPEEKFDFNNGRERIEVKSFAAEIRMHNFSLEQVCPPKDTVAIIASMCTKSTSTGKSVELLQAEIEFRISSHTHLVQKLRTQIALTLGKSIFEGLKVNFDHHLAKDSFRLFDTLLIPKIELANIPPAVSSVRFKSDLTNITALEKMDVASMGELFQAI